MQIVKLKVDISNKEVDQIRDYLTASLQSSVPYSSHGPAFSHQFDDDRTVIVVNHNKLPDLSRFDFVESILTDLPEYALASRKAKPDDTIVRVGDLEIGGPKPVIIAGPCAVENWEQMAAIAETIAKMGIRIMRGGAYKPRTSPYDFQGLKSEGIELLARVKKQFGLHIVTEVMSSDKIDEVEEVADVLQIGSRNMFNYPLLEALGQSDKPVMLKRGMSAKMKEWLMSAEYLLSRGNSQVILCERGIKSFEDATRNTLDLNVVPHIKQVSHLPVLVDPSHGTGVSSLVIPMSKAALAAGADGLLVEVHNHPEQALSDGDQAIDPMDLLQLRNSV